jgi:hypothetical protein
MVRRIRFVARILPKKPEPFQKALAKAPILCQRQKECGGRLYSTVGRRISIGVPQEPLHSRLHKMNILDCFTLDRSYTYFCQSARQGVFAKLQAILFRGRRQVQRLPPARTFQTDFAVTFGCKPSPVCSLGHSTRKTRQPFRR